MSIKNFRFIPVEDYLQTGIYHIPDYQREYSWTTKEEVDDFWNDLNSVVVEKRENHFFGQVVIHNDSEENKKYVIDGQQRTTTSVIFMAVLRDLYEELYQESQLEDARIAVEDIRVKFIGRWSEVKNQLRLTLGSIDKEYFKKNIQISKPEKIEKPEIDSHRRIKEAYEYLENKMKKIISESSSFVDRFNKIEEFYNKFLKGFQLMYVETDEINEAFIIFESLNARGKALETADLLKNHLFRISGRSIDLVKQTWMNTIENLEDIDVTKFLRHYWNSQYSFSRERELYKEIRNTVDTPKKSEEFVSNINEMSNIYKCLTNPLEEAYFNDQEIHKYLNHLRILKASSFYPVILAMVNSEFIEDDIKAVAHSIESLIFRNCVVADKVANRYEVLFAKIAYKISQKTFTTVDEIQSELKKEILNDEEFESAFKTFSLKAPHTAKYVLREINDYIDNEVQARSDNFKIHLEHILPQKKGDWDIDDETHDKYKNRIGNLTLLANVSNRSLQNKTFDKKKEIYRRSNLAITSSLSEYDTWNVDNIEKRQQFLCDIAKQRWRIFI
ncbi:DUF262 domain-containing HNH endonuclease family protein [Bacillus cereus]|uniref:DUF262 domain-containing protein n=1 Tax=Bacillus cereus group TaxID=86661 RepID=UPI0007F94C65|nr:MULTISPECIES: DUF262 domain-containing protein [Bacillus cereus group]ARV91515.1 hypothetical protein BJG91_02565 [Bacillus thuringiensis]MDZ4490293.1 DUF262 domain-containing HNH endonuclease family protein [Bacillus cereus]MDZ4571715.1 DUF262 domain-containing HNH endonuclease family protein [Bacillus cereus]MDZ4636501.1 DUF262 domain-containing HNH endonuclease family protein [Bacillus cereus]MEB9660172.1 DUF262 domain-containing HNH endonuclease family protein [Bacillus cereus]